MSDGLTLAKLDKLEAKYCDVDYCPCCEGMGAHGAECTFADECPTEFAALDAMWRQAAELEPVIEAARKWLEHNGGKE